MSRMVCISQIVFICEIREIRGQNFFRDLRWIAELSARWAWVIVGGCRIPGPLAQAIGTAGPLGRNRKPPARRAAFATAFRPIGPSVCIGCSGPTGRVQCVSAQRAIRSNSLAHRARSRNPKTTHHGPTGQPFNFPRSIINQTLGRPNTKPVRWVAIVLFEISYLKFEI